MPRPKKPGAPAPKRRSRTGCWQCKGRKVKCGEERPTCINCQKAGQVCDYSIRLNWDGRRTKRASYDSSSDSPVSPTRGQRPFAIINQTFKSGRHSWCPAAHPAPAEPIKEEPCSDDHATPNLGYDPNSAPAWTFKHQTTQPPAGGHMRSAGHTGDAGFPTHDQGPNALLASVRLGQLSPRPSIGNPQFMAPSGYPFHGPSSPEDYDSPVSAFAYPSREDGDSRETLDHAGVSPSVRYTSDAIATSVSLDEATRPLSMRFHQQHHSAMFAAPLTPGTPSSHGDEEPRLFAPVQAAHANPSSPDDRRMTVKSLLSGPSDLVYSSPERAFNTAANATYPSHVAYPLFDPTDETDFYGYDLGQVDEDMGKNDDMNAISPAPPAPLTPQEQTQEFMQGSGWGSDDVLPFDFRFGNRFQRQSTKRGGYYEETVEIKIPRSLGPLPAKLLGNPMNLLYFHHFLNHTARALMPYDDVESNPFRIILPQMAVKNDHLLSLLLAYSASHRARLLQQKEPEMRMAHWVQDIFPALRFALEDDTRIISTTNLATAIMLASLEIVSPKAFGYAIPWQEHLNLARDLMRKRFPALRQMHSSSHEDQVCSFLWGWFAYLDVLGSLSGGPRGNGSSFLVPMDQSDDPDEIDCIMGFTTRCLHLLSETADLASASDAQRIRLDNTVDHTWRPCTRTVELAASLDEALRESLSRQSAPCTHIPFAPSGRNTLEMAATNEAFHWAALVQLHRRALGKSPGHDDVRGPVWMIMSCLARIQSGTAEMGMLFPMFTAGCELEDEGARREILERFRNVERNGMTQIRRARELMEKVWEEGRPWETMLKNEFIG